jgi:hypothetical protein
MSKDPAKSRFIAIQLMRWVGLGMVLFGLLIVNGRVGLPPLAGYIFVIVGLFDALFMPTILARRWKSPEQ